MFGYLAMSETSCIIYRQDLQLTIETEISINVQTKNIFKYDYC